MPRQILLRGPAIAIVVIMSEQRRRGGRADLAVPGDHRAPPRVCDWPGCRCAGDYRAPASRERLRAFRHFCLEHVREYNRSWDFFAGMSRSEIEGYLREDVTWHRPTWPMGSGRPYHGNGWRWQDPFEVFVNGSGTNGTHGASEWDRKGGGRLGKTERMLAVLDLSPEVTRVEIKARYKQLVKLHHPDLHGGDKKAEERLKLINEAYTYLRDSDLFA